MKLEWILHPLPAYALVAMAMVACLYLYLLVQRQIQAAGQQSVREDGKLRGEVIRLEQEMAALRAELRELSEASLAASRPTQSGLNMNRRAQALRMARRGERPDQIAAALQLPSSEVNLLLKVHLAVPEKGALKALDRAVADDGDDIARAVGAARS